MPTFPLLLLLACASGLGSGAFHPFGALNVRALLSAWRRSFGMSIYVTAGTVGVALGPLIGIGVLALFGIHGTGLLVIPGVVTGAAGIPINGAIADVIGLQKSLMTHAILVLATIVIAWFLPRESEMECYSEVVPAVTPAIAT